VARLERFPKTFLTQAAAYPTVGYTALTGFKKYKEGTSVLIVGASGGCGQAAILLAKSRKIKNIYCISSKKNTEVVTALGCTEVFDYKDPKFEQTVVSKLKGKVGMVYDAVTGPFDSYYLKLLNQTLVNDGTYVGLNVVVEAYLSGYKNFHAFMASASSEEIAYASTHPALFQVKIAYYGTGLNLDDVNHGYDLVKSSRAVGKVVMKLSD